MSQPILFVGGGNMAGALIGGLLADGVHPATVTVLDPDDGQLARLSSMYGVQTVSQPSAALQNVGVVIWAVKPQVFSVAAYAVAPFTGAALHVSIAAGIRLQDLTRWLASDRVVRAMPNTATLVGAGSTGLLAGDGVSPADRELVARLLAGTGSTFWVGTDEEMNAVTAVSGSGPAYVFHFLEGLQRAAERVGFSAAHSRELALQVVSGAVKQAYQADEPFKVLRERVTSKRGTTEAAIAVLDQHSTQDALVHAVLAARDRGRELGAELGATPT